MLSTWDSPPVGSTLGSPACSRPTIIAILNNGEVRIYEDLEAALEEWGPRDVLSEAVVLYDESGVWLEPIESWGPRRLGGLIRGKLQVALRPNPESDWPDPIGLVLAEASELVANRHFESLEELRARYPWEPDGS